MDGWMDVHLIPQVENETVLKSHIMYTTLCVTVIEGLLNVHQVFNNIKDWVMGLIQSCSFKANVNKLILFCKEAYLFWRLHTADLPQGGILEKWMHKSKMLPLVLEYNQAKYNEVKICDHRQPLGNIKYATRICKIIYFAAG